MDQSNQIYFIVSKYLCLPDEGVSRDTTFFPEKNDSVWKLLNYQSKEREREEGEDWPAEAGRVDLTEIQDLCWR